MAAFGKGLVDMIERKTRKGIAVYVEGKIRTRSFEKNGETHRATEIVLDMNGAIRFPERDQGEGTEAG